MSTTATAAAVLNTRKAGAPTPTPANFINSNDHSYNLDAHRAQRLISLAGISPALAAIVSPFVYGGAA